MDSAPDSNWQLAQSLRARLATLYLAVDGRSRPRHDLLGRGAR